MLRLLLWLLGAATLLAQGELRLTVTDSAGVPMPASGSLNVRRFDTDARGAATLSKLSYGSYKLTVTRPGFAPRTQVIDIENDTPVRRTIALQLAMAKSAIDVIEATPLPGINLNRDEVPTPEAMAHVLAEAAALRSALAAMPVADLVACKLLPTGTPL